MAMLDEVQVVDYAVDLRSLMVALISRIGERQESPLVVLARRVRRIVVTAVTATAAIVALAVWGPSVWYSLRHPVITPAPMWHTSSTAYGAPQFGQDMVPFGAHDIFFHTSPQNEPWIEFEFDQPQSVGSIEVWNRTDCCVERVAPLVVETSVDDEHWTVAARRQYSFIRWRNTFRPVEARYVRLRVASESSTAVLHLEKVLLRH
jgi:hypothetical protein